MYSARGRVWLRNCPKGAFAFNPGGPCLSLITIFRALCVCLGRVHALPYTPSRLTCLQVSCSLREKLPRALGCGEASKELWENTNALPSHPTGSKPCSQPLCTLFRQGATLSPHPWAPPQVMTTSCNLLMKESVLGLRKNSPSTCFPAQLKSHKDPRRVLSLSSLGTYCPFQEGFSSR